MEPFIGQIILFAGNFAPRGWALCDGQMLDIASHSALYSILGTTYGGNGTTTFALPDLRSRAPVHVGQGPGLSRYTLGERTGVETVTLTTQQIPSHGHEVMVASQPADGSSNPRGASLAAANIYVQHVPEATLNAKSVTNTGGGQSHDNIQPVLALNYIIAMVGLFPSRN